MRTKYLIAAAVTAALAAGVATAATPPTAAQAAAATDQIWVAGSSAAKAAILAAVETNVCGGAGNFSVFTTNPAGSPNGTPDFNAVSCTAVGGPTSGSSTTVYYRAEGGSAVGVLPVFNNTLIKYLDLSSCPTGATGSVTCTFPAGQKSGLNGLNDSWGAGINTNGSGFSMHNVDIGISDLEPAIFAAGNTNDPTSVYTHSFTGDAQTSDALAGLAPQTVIQQVFGIIVNTSTTGSVTAAQVGTLGKTTIQNVLQGAYSNWNQVPAANGTGTVTTTSVPIILCNREVGSGSRAATDLYFTEDTCNTNGTSPIAEVAGKKLNQFGFTGPTQPVDNFATSDEQTCVLNNAGAIGYVSIDKTNAGYTFVKINGATVSNLAAASGAYDFAFEATVNVNPNVNTTGTGFASYLINQIEQGSTTGQGIDVNVLPGLGTTANKDISQNGGSLQSFGASPVYSTEFDRGGGGAGSSCTPMTAQ
jgi:hypothetical protein